MHKLDHDVEEFERNPDASDFDKSILKLAG